ncbi:MAG TPA: methyltransferase [Clostridiaceae bacterium]|nr:methyltransferase [Clostridiaceae bacterium]
MNSRERVLASISHKEPDHLAVDLGATPSSGISAIAYNNLIKYLNISNTRNRVYDVVQQVTQPEMEVLDRFRIDVLDVGRMFNDSDEDWYDVLLPDGSKAQYPSWFRPVGQDDGSYIVYSKDGEAIAKMPKGATFFDQLLFPFIDGYPDNYKNLHESMNKVHWQALAHSPWDNACDKDFWTKLREKAIELRKTSDLAIMIVCGCNLFEWGTFLRRIDNFLMDLVLCPDEVERLLDALMEIHMDTLAKVCQAVGDVVDIIRFGDDLGMDSGPFMSPEIYRKIFKPRHKMLCEYVKKNSGMKTLLHSCGSIYKLIPDLIEAGYDIINPVQISAKDMEPGKLKKEFGKDITFWGGGCDTRTVLNQGTPQQVKDHVRRNIETFAPGGGFVFNTVHNIMPDVPPENIEAMFEAVDEYR